MLVGINYEDVNDEYFNEFVEQHKKLSDEFIEGKYPGLFLESFKPIKLIQRKKIINDIVTYYAASSA